MREKRAGSLRITSVEHATDTIIAPVLARLLPNYPDIRVEVINDYALRDIVADRYDAGVRLGEQVAKDMIAVPIGPDFRNAVVGAPSQALSPPFLAAVFRSTPRIWDRPVHKVFAFR